MAKNTGNSPPRDGIDFYGMHTPDILEQFMAWHGIEKSEVPILGLGLDGMKGLDAYEQALAFQSIAESAPSLELSQRFDFSPGLEYGVRLEDGGRLEGSCEDIGAKFVLLRSGREYDSQGTFVSDFDREEVSLDLIKDSYRI